MTLRSRVFLLFSTLVLTASSAFAQDDLGQQLATRGIFLTLLSVFAAGLAVSVTPCVYPMIPITLSIIGARSVGQKPLTGFLRSLTFVLGIAVVYTAVGLIAASLGKGFQFILQNKYFWFFLAAFFVAMGFSMMGAFNIQLPARFQGKLQGATSGKGGFVGAFLVGLVTGVAASPCGTPVLAGLMAYGASKANMPLVVSMFFVYALGIGFLFLLLGTVPAFMKAIPKPGGWMEDVKKFLGFVLIGVGIYYLRSAFYFLPAGAMLFYWILVVVAALVGGAMIAVKAAARKDMPRMMLAERVLGVGLVLFALYVAIVQVPSFLGSGKTTPTAEGPKLLSGDKLLAEARSVALDEKKYAALAKPVGDSENTPGATPGSAPANVNAAGAGAPDEWLHEEPAALAMAREKDLPVIIDFGAEWCAACKQLEKESFPVEPAASLLKNFVKVKIDCTEANETNEALQKKYKAQSLPHVVLIDKTGKVREDLTLLKFESPDALAERLKKVM